MSPSKGLKNRPSPTLDVKARTIHRKGTWSIDDYMTIFHVPAAKKAEESEWFLKLTQHIQSEEIRILCPGVGAGRNELVLIEALASSDPDRKIICDFIDYSPISCESLRSRLRSELRYREKGLNEFEKENLTIKLLEMDYEDWLKDGIKPRYEIILAFFIINFLSNWVQSLKNTIRLLVPGGVFIVSQDVGDLCFVDNSFKEIPPEMPTGRHKFYHLWRAYYDHRKKLGFEWNSLISPSNMEIIEDIFNDIHRLAISVEEKQGLSDRLKTAILQPKSDSLQLGEITWTLGDVILENPAAKDLKLIEYWLSLIRGIGGAGYLTKENEVFNCLFLPSPLREALALEVRKELERFEAENEKSDYKNKTGEIDDLSLGQAFYFLYKPNAENIDAIVDHVIESKLNSIGAVSRYRFINRSESLSSESLKKVAPSLGITKSIRADLLNRARDSFNTSVNDKHSAIVSLLSREYQPGGASEHLYEWRKNDSPVVFDPALTIDEKMALIKSYAFYFAQSAHAWGKNRSEGKKNPTRITGMLYDELPKKISLTISVHDQDDDVKAFFYHTGELRAINISLDRLIFKSKLSDNIGKILRNIPNKLRIPGGGEIDFEILLQNRDYVFTEEVKYFSDAILKKADLLDEFHKRIVELADTRSKLPRRIAGIICKAMEIHSVDDFMEIEKTLSLIYAQLVVGFDVIEWDTLNYTSTNSFMEDATEKGYYGLIVYDRLNHGGDHRLIEKNLDRLLPSTFFYSGMDGIYETNREVRRSEWVKIIQELRHNVTNHLEALSFAKNGKEIAFIADDIANCLKLTKYYDSDEKMAVFIHEETEREEKENQKTGKETLLIKDVINPAIKIVKSIVQNNPILFMGGETNYNALKQSPGLLDCMPAINDFPIKTISWLGRQVFLNILTNAVKNVNATVPMVKVEIKQLPSRSVVEVSVTNNKSISENYLKQINDINAPLNESDHLGIYIYKKYARALGWKLKGKMFSTPEQREITQILLEIPILTKEANNVEDPLR